jgi:hypothetical protein
VWSPARAAPSDTRQPRELCSRSMDDCRVALHRARAAAHISEAARVAARMEAEAARLNAEADAAVAVRAAGVSLWASELPPLVLQQVLELLKWQPAVCRAVRLVCFTWSSILDALYPGRLQLQYSSFVVMKGKMAWFPSVTEVVLDGYEADGVSGVLAELASMPSLRSLTVPWWCAHRAVDAEALYAITTLTKLFFRGVSVPGEWALDLSRLTPSLTSLDLCSPGQLWASKFITDKQVLELSNLTGLTNLNLAHCSNVTSEGLQTLSSLTALTWLNLAHCYNVTSEGLQTLSSLTALTTLDLFLCYKVSAAAKQALRTAIPNLTIKE